MNVKKYIYPSVKCDPVNENLQEKEKYSYIDKPTQAQILKAVCVDFCPVRWFSRYPHMRTMVRTELVIYEP